jgi:hypothetical protein
MVFAPDGWHSLESARAAWVTGAPYEDEILLSLLTAAKAQCLAFAPPLTTAVTDSHRLAQLMQARNLLNSSKTDPAQSADGDMFVIRPYPLDSWVKQLLRPRKALGAIR